MTGRMPGFFDIDERLRELTAKGDGLERVNALVDFEMFREALETAVPRGDRSKLDEIYTLFPELAERRHQHASRLSGGQQQILAVAQGMIAEPKLLMLDEPSGGLAPLVIDRILDVASALARRGVAVLLVEQLVEKALVHADRCYLMSTGRIVHEGLAKDLAGSDVLHSAYLGEAV